MAAQVQLRSTVESDRQYGADMHNGEGALATTGPYVNSLEPFFGPPTKAIDAHPSDRFPHEAWFLPDAYGGRNDYVRETIVQTVINYNSFMTSEILPWREQNNPNIAWDSIKFDKTLIDMEPEQGVPRYVTVEREAHTDYMVRRGLALIVNHGFAATPGGQKDFMYKVATIAGAVQETCDQSGLVAMLRCKNQYSSYAADSIRRASDAYDMFQQELWRFGIIQMTERGWYHMDAEASNTMQLANINPDTWIVPNRMTSYAAMGQLAETEVYRAGETVARANLEQGKDRFTSFRGKKVFETRPYQLDVDGRIVDPLNRDRMIGDFFVVPCYGMDTYGSGSKLVPTKFRGKTQAYCCETDRFETFTWESMRNKAGLQDVKYKDLIRELACGDATPDVETKAFLQDMFDGNELLSDEDLISQLGTEYATMFDTPELAACYLKAVQTIERSIRVAFSTPELMIDLYATIAQMPNAQAKSVIDLFANQRQTFGLRFDHLLQSIIQSQLFHFFAYTSFLKNSRTWKQDDYIKQTNLQVVLLADWGHDDWKNHLTNTLPPAARLHNATKTTYELFDTADDAFAQAVQAKCVKVVDSMIGLDDLKDAGVYEKSIRTQFTDTTDNSALFNLILQLKMPDVTAPCFDLLCMRPFRQYTMGTGILLQKGSELGNTFRGWADFQLTDNIIAKTHIGHFTFWHASIVTNPKCLFLAEDIFCTNYISGEGKEVFSWKNREQFREDPLNAMAINNASIICLPVPVGSVNPDDRRLNLLNPISLTGDLDPIKQACSSHSNRGCVNIGDYKEHQREVQDNLVQMYNTWAAAKVTSANTDGRPCKFKREHEGSVMSKAYNDLFRFSDVNHSVDYENSSTFENAAGLVNLICFHTMQKHVNPHNGRWEVTNLNTGHFGENGIYEGCKRIRCGFLDVFKEMNYQKSMAMGGLDL